MGIRINVQGKCTTTISGGPTLLKWLRIFDVMSLKMMSLRVAASLCYVYNINLSVSKASFTNSSHQKYTVNGAKCLEK